MTTTTEQTGGGKLSAAELWRWRRDLEALPIGTTVRARIPFFYAHLGVVTLVHTDKRDEYGAHIWEAPALFDETFGKLHAWATKALEPAEASDVATKLAQGETDGEV